MRRLGRREGCREVPGDAGRMADVSRLYSIQYGPEFWAPVLLRAGALCDGSEHDSDGCAGLDWAASGASSRRRDWCLLAPVAILPLLRAPGALALLRAFTRYYQGRYRVAWALSSIPLFRG